MTQANRYWLHVPLEMPPGVSLDTPLDKRVSFMGQSAQLLDRKLSVHFPAPAAMVVTQWLLFDPASEADARNIFTGLLARAPGLSVNLAGAFRIAHRELRISELATYDGHFPALIPGHMTPNPMWGNLNGTCSFDGQEVLESLGKQTPVFDQRLLAALDLSITAQHDSLPRSIYLAHLTILDALAVHSKRSDAVIDWIDAKIKEVEAFDDKPLMTALQNLKWESHASAIRALVVRAAISEGATQEEANQAANCVGKLYAARSKLSHIGSNVDLNLGDAVQLATRVLNAAIQNPSILDVVDDNR